MPSVSDKTPPSWPLDGYESAPPLPTTSNPSDANSLVNPPSATLSPAYTAFPSPITPSGFDIHVYFTPEQLPYARALHSRIRYEFPELRIFKIHEQPIGPHVRGMFEIDVYSPQVLGAIVAWLVVWRGDLSVLMHPNTGDPWGDHTVRATWFGEKLAIREEIFKRLEERKIEQEGGGRDA